MLVCFNILAFLSNLLTGIYMRTINEVEKIINSRYKLVKDLTLNIGNTKELEVGEGGCGFYKDILSLIQIVCRLLEVFIFKISLSIASVIKLNL